MQDRTEPDEDRLIGAWIHLQHAAPDSEEYARNLWAEFELSRYSHDDPERCWTLLLQILERAGTDAKVLQGLSAGALEDLLSEHGTEFIDRIEQEAVRNSAFRVLLGGVWRNEIPNDVWRRVQALVAQHW